MAEYHSIWFSGGSLVLITSSPLRASALMAQASGAGESQVGGAGGGREMEGGKVST